MAPTLRTCLALSCWLWFGLGAGAFAQNTETRATSGSDGHAFGGWHFDVAASLGDIKVDLLPGRYPTASLLSSSPGSRVNGSPGAS